MARLNEFDNIRTDGTPLATGIPPSVIWVVFLAIISTWILMKTRYGNWIFASVGDENGANNVGVPVGRVKLVCLLEGRSQYCNYTGFRCGFC